MKNNVSIQELEDQLTEKNDNEDPMSYNVGESDYSDHTIQPWHIWEEYDLNPWDCDIIKRILRTKKVKGMSKKAARILDYEKVIHICKFRLDQIERLGK